LEQHVTFESVETLKAVDTIGPPIERAELTAARALALAVTDQLDAARSAAASVLEEGVGLEAPTLANAALVASQVASEKALVIAGELLDQVVELGTVDACVYAVRVSARVREALETVRATDRRRSRLADQILALARTDPDGGHPSACDQRLSQRELEVLALVAQGLRNKQIAGALFISEVTVKAHLRHIFDKIGVRSRTAAALWHNANHDDAGETLADETVR
jgi:ATP/maltotriose-dependent transcriptional regulator MalT